MLDLVTAILTLDASFLLLRRALPTYLTPLTAVISVLVLAGLHLFNLALFSGSRAALCRACSLVVTRV